MINSVRKICFVYAAINPIGRWMLFRATPQRYFLATTPIPEWTCMELSTNIESRWNTVIETIGCDCAVSPHVQPALRSALNKPELHLSLSGAYGA